MDEPDTAPWFVGLRGVDRLRMRRDPLLRRTYEQAACVVGIAPYVGDFLAGTRVRRFEVMSETGIDTVAPVVDRSGRTGPVRLLFVGRLVRTKGAREAIRAVASLAELPVVLDVVGDGFDREACESLAAELGVTPRVTFHGRQPHEQVEEFYRRADVFVFPSYREPGGNVVFEAMSFGLPLVVCSRGGPGNVVDDSCGFRLPADTPEQLATDVAESVARLVTDPALRRSMGAAARLRVEQIALWDRKVALMTELYTDVLATVR